jgi:hypothetical protein
MQLVSLQFKKKIYKPDDPTTLIEAGDIVMVRLEATCSSCASTPDPTTNPNVVDNLDPKDQGDHRQTIERNSAYILDQEQNPPAPCVGAVVPLSVESVFAEGRGFTFDRTADGQHFRAKDIDQVQPDHDGVGCDASSS